MAVNNIERLINIQKYGKNNSLTDLYKEHSFYIMILDWSEEKAYDVLEARYLEGWDVTVDNNDKLIYDDIKLLVDRIQTKKNRLGMDLTDKQIIGRLEKYCKRYNVKAYPDLDLQIRTIQNFKKI